ncbi:MAG TPA: GNAT family N-acetyltransferase [Myxococcaceae bacterium]|jgi:GNAT superfamily N-acetyltransferase
MTVIRFEPLAGSHERAGFQSGVAELDDWFHKRASQDQRRRVAQVFVALDDVGVVGFYSLSMFAVALGTLPYELMLKLPSYGAVPAALIGRLARHVRAKGSGVGDLLVADAVRRVLGAAKAVAAYAIFVDAKDDRSRAFYESHGFIPLPSQPRKLFLPLQTAVRALEKAGVP